MRIEQAKKQLAEHGWFFSCEDKSSGHGTTVYAIREQHKVKISSLSVFLKMSKGDFAMVVEALPEQQEAQA